MSPPVFAVVWAAAWTWWVASYVQSFRAALRRKYRSPLPGDIRLIARRLILHRAALIAPIPATVVAFAADVAWTVLS